MKLTLSYGISHLYLQISRTGGKLVIMTVYLKQKKCVYRNLSAILVYQTLDLKKREI